MLPEVPVPKKNKIFMDTEQPAVPINEFKDIGIIENVDTTTRTKLFAHYSKFQIYSFCTISGIWIIFWAYKLVQKLQSPGANSEDLKGYFFVLLIPFIIFSILYANFQNKILKLFMQQFAKETGLTYLSSSKSVTEEKGSLFSIGHSKNITHLIGGKHKDHDVQMFYYKYTVGQGKHSHTYFSTVLRITHDHIVPPILLMVDRQNFGGISPSFEDSVKIKPELNFDSKFDLFAKQKYEIEALQIFKPEFLEVMLNRWDMFNIEFNENDIYIFTNSQIKTRSILQNMFAIGKKI